MSQTCGNPECGKVVYRRKYMPERKIWLGVDCGCVAADRIPRSCVNPWDLTLDHVNDELGHKLHVNSIRELSAAEKRLGFQHVVLNQDRQNWDDPPQQKPIDISQIHNWKFSDRQRYARRFQ
jgi:hypothetical protein